MDSGLLGYAEPADMLSILLSILKALFASVDFFLAVCQIERLVRKMSSSWSRGMSARVVLDPSAARACAVVPGLLACAFR